MKKSKKAFEVKVERAIPAPPGKVYDAWLNPKVPGNPWNMADKLILNPKVDGFFYWLVHGTPHYGRFTKVERPHRIQHTWMSPYTLGQESTVSVSFKRKAAGTLMTLVHSGLPDSEEGRAHEEGWNQFMDAFPKQFMDATRKKKK
jgi:uncharacterized protein YndB with AHSA1/START domain